MAKELEVQDLKAYSNSQLVIEHIRGDYEARGENMIRHLQKVKYLTSTFHSFKIQQIPRKENSWADLLSKLVTSVLMDLPKRAYTKMVKKPTIKESSEVM